MAAPTWHPPAHAVRRAVPADRYGARVSQKGHPHPGQRYRHGWIPITDTPSPGVDGAIERDARAHPKEALRALRDMEPGSATRDQMLPYGRAIFGGSFDGLTVKVTGAMRKDDHVMFAASIYDADGKYQGVARRAIHFRPDGGAHVEHRSIELEPAVHGQGFAEAFNANAEQWYRDAGIEHIGLTANIDVGGYAWARQGYDWADSGQVKQFVPALKAMAEQDPGNAELADMLARLDRGEHVSPYEISQLGRPPGTQGKGAIWPGKRLMLNSKWEGVKWL